jgi:hypothetical protein
MSLSITLPNLIGLGSSDVRSQRRAETSDPMFAFQPVNQATM